MCVRARGGAGGEREHYLSQISAVLTIYNHQCVSLCLAQNLAENQLRMENYARFLWDLSAL